LREFAHLASQVFPQSDTHRPLQFGGVELTVAVWHCWVQVCEQLLLHSAVAVALQVASQVG
jgi:hypothetical protein